MMLLIAILRDDHHVRTVVRVLVELGLFDSTVLDGEAIENLAVRSIPLFEDVGRWFGQTLDYNRTLLVAVRDRSEVDTLLELCRRDGLDLRDARVGTLLLVPCERIAPTEPEAAP